MKKFYRPTRPLRKFTPVFICAGFALTLAMVLAFHPGAKAEMRHIVDNAASWVRFNTAIPIRLPGNKLASDKTFANRTPSNPSSRLKSGSQAALTRQGGKYYFAVDTTPDGYDINVYLTDGKTRESADKSGKVPFDDSQLVGNINAQLRHDDDDFAPGGQFTSAESVVNATRLVLRQDIVAANFDSMEVSWETDNWHYSVQGQGAVSLAKKLVDALNTTPVPEASKGDLQVVISTQVTTYIRWNFQEYQYEFVYRGEDFQKAFEAARNTTLWMQKKTRE